MLGQGLGTGDMIQDKRVMWLCRACFEAGTRIKDMIQGNRVMWLCRTYLKARIRMGGYAGHILWLGWGGGM